MCMQTNLVFSHPSMLRYELMEPHVVIVHY